jgi:hypothetical protein
MSQQAAVGHGRREKLRYFPQGVGKMARGFKCMIMEIAHNALKRGQNKFAAQFTQLQKMS